MKPLSDGGPFHPIWDAEQRWTDENGILQARHEGSDGLSLRDWFAGQALAGLCAQSAGSVTTPEDARLLMDGIPMMAYALADRMLRARTPHDSPSGSPPRESEPGNDKED